MYLAINKKNPKEYHSFTWTPDNKLIICGLSVSADEWEIIWVEEVKRKY